MVEHFDNRARSLDFGAGARTEEHQAPTPRRWGRGLLAKTPRKQQECVEQRCGREPRGLPSPRQGQAQRRSRITIGHLVLTDRVMVATALCRGAVVVARTGREAGMTSAKGTGRAISIVVAGVGAATFGAFLAGAAVPCRALVVGSAGRTEGIGERTRCVLAATRRRSEDAPGHAEEMPTHGSWEPVYRIKDSVHEWVMGVSSRLPRKLHGFRGPHHPWGGEIHEANF
jgi:hypothetical protein